jgi:hypothetical protein
MSLLAQLSLAAVISMTFTIGPAAYSQTRDAKRKQADLTGQRAWVVTKGSLNDFSGRSDKAVADFDSETEANAYAERRNEEEKEWTKWTYVVTKRDRGGPTNGGQEKDDGDRVEGALRQLARGEISASRGSEKSSSTLAVKKPIVVKVYKREGNQWVEQRDRRYETPNDFVTASDYFNKVKKVNGWSASWNAPGWPKPKEFKEEKPYNPPNERYAAWAFVPGLGKVARLSIPGTLEDARSETRRYRRAYPNNTVYIKDSTGRTVEQQGP